MAGSSNGVTVFFHETLDEVRSGVRTSHWTPEAQVTAVWPRVHIQLVEGAARAAFDALNNHFDPLWPQLFGWLPGKEVKRQP
jgi:hypothetical protein